MPVRMSRGSVLVRGAAVLGSAGAFGVLAAPAAAAVPDADLAYVRLLIAIELLKIDYGLRAAVADAAAPATRHFVRRIVLDDKRHYGRLATLMAGAGETPATGSDVDFSYPRGTFATQRTIAKLGRRLATLATGAYTGALENVQTPELRGSLAQIAANEAQQAGAFGQLLGGRVVGSAFVQPLTIDAVSAALDEYES
jgi:Ferritin-like domain